LAAPVLLSQLSLTHCVSAFPGPSDTRRWANNEIVFNLPPTTFPSNTPEWQQVQNAIYSWRTVTGSSFLTWYWTNPLDVSPSIHTDTLSTIGFVGTITDPRVLGVTDFAVYPSTTSYREADISLNGNANWNSPTSHPDSFPPYSVFSLELAVRHEAGHAVGFHGEEGREPRVAVMDSVYSWGGQAFWNLHGDDRNGVRTFYPASGNEWNVRALGWALKSNYNKQAKPVLPPAPQYISSKQSISVEYTVENLGTIAYQDTVKFYLSQFQSIVPSSDTQIGATALSLPAAKGGDAVMPILTATRSLTVPCGISGINFIGAYAQNPVDQDAGDNVSTLTTPEHPYPIQVTDLSPTPPGFPQGSFSDCNHVLITWQDRSADEIRFNILRGGEVIGTAIAGSTSFEDSPPLAGFVYSYEVSAENSTCESDRVPTTGARRAPPAKPTGVTATTSRCDLVRITWPSVPDLLTGFQVLRDLVPKHTVPPGGGTTWDDSSAVAGTSYQYQILPFNECGTGTTPSDPLTGLRTNPPTATPAASASNGYCPGILVWWTWASTGQDSFQIYRGGTHVHSVRGDTLSWMDTSALAQSSQQTYTVRGRFPGNCFGPFSGPATGTRLKPIQYRIISNVSSAQAFDNGAPILLTGAGYAVTCTTCTASATRQLSVSPTQVVSGTRYCFDRWSDGGRRSHTVALSSDTTITLYLTASSGPTTIRADTTLYDDAYDCKSPYVFRGSATLRTSSPADTFKVWGMVSFRAPKNTFPPASLNIRGSLYAKGARFETTDTTAAVGNLWDGLRLSGGGALVLDSCEVRNAFRGIADSSYTTSIACASVDRSIFQENQDYDVLLNFDPTRSPLARFVHNDFHNPKGLHIKVAGSSVGPVATATITDNFFYTAGPSGSLIIEGGWRGNADRNIFTINKSNSWGVWLDRSNNASPSVSFTNNTFNIVAGSLRMALRAPPRTDSLVQVNATNNDWDYDTRQQIEDIIQHGLDNNTLAIVAFEPWTHPVGGGGGGGGGGGCPFLLTETANGLTVENSILGVSAMTGAIASDAYPLREDPLRVDGRIRIQIAEMGSEVDEIDEVKLASVIVPEGYQLGSDGAGHPVLFKPAASALRERTWSGKAAPFVSPVSPTTAYRGEAGDSLEFHVDSDGTIVFPGKRRFGINLIPKPTAPSFPGGRGGVSIRVSPDTEGNRWYTLDRVIPRETWSPTLIPLDILGDQAVRRVRVIWHSSHTLGWAGLASVEPAMTEFLPCRSARHSDGQSVLTDLIDQDRRNVTVLPGEHIDLEFDASDAPEVARFVLMSHGRYFHPDALEPQGVPRAYSLAQNRPNPFNPSTEISFGLPRPSHVSLRVYSVAGRLVRMLVDGDLPAGYHGARWDGRNDQGGSAASGIYFYELRAGFFSDRRRMALLR